MPAPDTYITNGQTGGIKIPDGDTAAHRGNFSILKALTDVVFETVTGNITNADGSQGGLDGETLVAGDFVVGKFDSVKLTSGTLIAYHG